MATIIAWLIKLSSQVVIQFLAKFLSSNKWIMMHVGVHKPTMKAIGEMFRDEDSLIVQALCFMSMPDLPMSIFTGLQNLG